MCFFQLFGYFPVRLLIHNAHDFFLWKEHSGAVARVPGSHYDQPVDFEIKAYLVQNAASAPVLYCSARVLVVILDKEPQIFIGQKETKLGSILDKRRNAQFFEKICIILDYFLWWRLFHFNHVIKNV